LLCNRTQCPEALESLVALMMVVGPKFDYPDWQHHGSLIQIFSEMAALTKDKAVSPRCRFLVRDVLDAREAGWAPSPGGIKAPAKLEEVRNIAAIPPPSQQQRAAGAIDCCLSALRSPKDNSSSGDKTHKAGNKGGNNSVKLVAEAAHETSKEEISAVVNAFNVVAFRKALALILSDLASDKNIPGAVQRIRQEAVPIQFQADLFVDILSRVVEERCGAVRRCELAFLAGLAAAETSAFDRKECLAGINLFFKDVYGDLCDEVHRLPAIVKSEFLPTVLTVLPLDELNKVVPLSMRK